MYDRIAFTHETVDGVKTYLEWEGQAFGMDVAGTTTLSRNGSGLIASIRLYHRPLHMVVKFSAELGRRLNGNSTRGYSSFGDECSISLSGRPASLGGHPGGHAP
jgi:hypothetical protein